MGSEVPVDRTERSIPLVGVPPSARKLDVQITRVEPGALDVVTEAFSWGRRSSVKRSGAIQCVPMKGSKPCFVFEPGVTRFAPGPALFQRISSLDSWAAKLFAAVLTESRSFRSSSRNLSWPWLLVEVELLTMVWIADSAFSWFVLTWTWFRLDWAGLGYL